ncbi:hypothetical protein [Pseudomonas syringae]|uniref:Predicted periplasmic solute-binding protein n=4 Tax=Pseudomonas syringae TaxID=317 RepID=A0AAN4TMX0_PSESF|nr:hypothetical protein [Pseudomonas syringae]GBH19320.1 Predicted periplasmic solute-binding protein [Pseudomonas syringae pv. actinidiae]
MPDLSESDLAAAYVSSVEYLFHLFTCTGKHYRRVIKDYISCNRRTSEGSYKMDAMSLYWLSMGGAMLMVAVTAFFKVVVASTV